MVAVHRNRGFTLIELVLAMTLLGMLLTMLYSGLRLGLRSVEDGEQRMDRVARVRLTQEFLRYQLSRVQPVIWKEDGETGVVFEGEQGRLQFVAPMPGYVGKGGPHVQLIELVDRDEGMELIFDHRIAHPELDGDVQPDPDRPPILLLDGIEKAHFSFLTSGEENEPGDWVDSWDDVEQYPLLVRLELQMQEGQGVTWPTLTVAPLIDPAASRAARLSRLNFGARPNQ